MKFRTLNSDYTIDTEAMTWSRQVRGDRSRPVLWVHSGPLAAIPEPVVGQRCAMLETSEGLHGVIYTSMVIEVLDA
jgi:hypothetical protein